MFEKKTMSELLQLKLPADLIPLVREFTGEIRIRNGVPMRQIKTNDRRYAMLRRSPKIKQLGTSINLEYEKRGSVWFKTPDKSRHVVISVYYERSYRRLVREMRVLGGPVITMAI
jgi:hypothetical protein